MSIVTILDTKDAPSEPVKSKRQRRTDGRGNVWCTNCKRYLPSYEFRRHYTYPDRWWPYCKPCTRELDRLRWTGERRERLNARRVGNKRRQSQGEFAQRRAELVSGISLLRRRGLTYTDIAVICGLHRANMTRWADGQIQRPTEAVVARIGELVALTIDWPLADTPIYGRRLPHPQRDELQRAMKSTIREHPVRNGWHTYDERPEAA